MVDVIVSKPEFRRNQDKLEEVRETVKELVLYEDESKGGYSMREREQIMRLNLKFEVYQDYNF